MAPRSPALTSRLVQIAASAEAAGHGGKEAIYAAAVHELGISRATLMRHLKEVAVKPARKRRSDAGEVSLTRKEAVLISAVLMESLRKNNKRLLSIDQAVELLRSNKEIRAEKVDKDSGEVTPLSASAIGRALRSYGLHPDQLLAPSAAKELRSLHPNHVWQIDASLCVLYYLNARTPKEAGLQVMDHKKFYKNKPGNLKKIESDRVWSYEVTDHNSGAIFVHYVLGAESAANLSESFIAAIQQRGNDPFHGVPYYLMMDMGSAMTSGLFKNLARRLDVKLLPHAPGNARATGQVENARNIIERSFESGLKFTPVSNLEELNAKALQWASWYNSTKKHSRHGMTRFARWQTIQAEQLRLAPSPERCRELLTHSPETRPVSDMLTIQFKGGEYDVSGVPRVMVGEKLMVTLNPYNADAAYIVDVDSEGNELLHAVPMVQRLDDGFRVDGNVIGEDYSRHADSQADRNRKEVEQAAMGVSSAVEAEAARKAKKLPFDGRLDAWKTIEEAPAVSWMPKRGSELPSTTRLNSQAMERVLNQFEAARELVSQGVEMTPEKNRQIADWYPDGVPESELPQLTNRLATRAGLRVVGERGAL